MMANLTASFSNILAYGLTQIAGNPERNGWKWIFIFEGSLTVGYGVLCWFLVPALPHTAGKNKCLSAKEKAIVKRRLLADVGSFESSKVTWTVIGETLRPLHIWNV